MAVVLSTYNPNLLFLKAQIDSLLDQDLGADSFDVIIRDDGSKDKEVLSYLKTLPSLNSNVIVYFGVNVGVFSAFWTLIQEAYNRGYEYVSLSDQDDIALPNKLSLAVKKLEKEDQNTPLLFFSQMTYVNEKLETQGVPNVNEKCIGFKNALYESSVNGNLMVLNHKACELVISQKPETFYMHDWWIYMCVSAFGKILYTPQPTLLYRQHADNVIGGTQSFLGVMKRRFKRFCSYSENTYPVFKQGMEFKRLFLNKLTPDVLSVLNRLELSKKSFLKRFLYALSCGNFERMSSFDNLLVRILILTNKY